MDYPKSVPNVGLVNGKFVDENTATGQVGSLIPASWGNAVTAEVLNVLAGASIAPDEFSNDQLYRAISKIVVDKGVTKEELNKKADKAVTLGGYGITDAFTKSEVSLAIQNAVAVKADKATTLAGYGIKDAYSKAEVDMALAPLGQATEERPGTAKISTWGQMTAGDESVIVTPRKLRWGFSITQAQNGGIIFPFWLGGLVIQWGVIITTGGRTGPFGSFAFPFAFPTGVFSIVASSAANNANSGLDLAASGIPIVAFDAVSTTGARWRTDSNNGTNMANGIPVRWLAIGY